MSSHTDDPQPRSINGRVPELRWAVRRSIRCPPVVPPIAQTFSTVLEMRRSERMIDPATLREIVNVIGFATRPRFILANDPLGRSRRPAGSGGALHAIDIVLAALQCPTRIMRYQPLEHALDLLRLQEASFVQAFARRCGECLPHAHATALILIGNVGRLSAAYEHPESVLWRDAGTLLQTLALVSTAYRLAFCPAGILGHEIISALALGDNAIACGAAIIGRKRAC